MNKTVKAVLKRVTALFLALTIVMSFALTRASDRVLHATALDEEYDIPVPESHESAEEAELAFADVELVLPAEQDRGSETDAGTGDAQEAAGQEPGDLDTLLEAAEGTDTDLPGSTAEETGEHESDPLTQAPEEALSEKPENGEGIGEETPQLPEDEDTEPSEEETEEPEEKPKEITVTFLDRDNQVVTIIRVEKGQALETLPTPVAREDYHAFWAVGSASQGGQGTVWTPVRRITASYIPESDVTIVPDYDPVTYNVRFYPEAGPSSGEILDTRTVNADTSYCLNDIPPVPVKTGYAGHWAYEGGPFTNTVPLSGDTDVWVVYEQQVFNVRFTVSGRAYASYTVFSGDPLPVPASPVAEGKSFTGWTAGGKTFTGGEPVNADLELSAVFEDQLKVTFLIRASDSGLSADESFVQYFPSAGGVIGTLPQAPFAAGKVFDRWVVDGTDRQVTVPFAVTEDLTVTAVFRPVEVYTVTAICYYLNVREQEVVFETQILEIESGNLPYTLTAPASTQTDPDEIPGAPIYYPERASEIVTPEAFDENGCYVTRFRYVPSTAVYDVSYLLKNLSGTGYTEFDRDSGIPGVLGSHVTPTVRSYDFAVPESVGETVLTKVSGQKIEVRYTRRPFTLSYESNGGSYIPAVTAPYGTAVTLSSETPARDGYRFAGWYLDAALTSPAGKKLTLDHDTTLYAAWEAAEVDYTLVYLFEKYNEAGTASSYVYDNSATARAKSGTTVRADSSSIPSKTVKGWEKDTERNRQSEAVIAADGSTVLYVYYRLKTYTFMFNAGTFSSYKVTADLTGRGVSGTGTLSYTMSVKLGQDISAQWPANATGTYSKGKTVLFNGWQPAGGSTRYVTKRTTVTQDMLPSSGSSITYTAQWASSAKTYTVHYWLQNADDDGYTDSPVYSQTYTSSSGNLSAKEISGYTYDHGNSGAQNTTEYNFYYNRNTYRIDYYDGPVRLKTIDSVKFDSDISTDAFRFVPDDPERSGVYTWGGWYSNSGLEGEPYSFDTMPSSNLVLYARWIPPRYTVSFDLNGGQGTADAQTLEIGKKATPPANPTRPGFVFDGWYTGAEDGTLFDWQKPITGDTVLFARWGHTLMSYTVRYVDTEGRTLVPDKTVTNPAIGVGDIVTEQAVTVAGHRPDAGSKTLTLTLDKNELSFIYSAKTEKTSYRVLYLLEGTQIPVAPEKIVEDVDGNTLSVVESAPSPEQAFYAANPAWAGVDLHPDASKKELILGSDVSQNVLIFTYSTYQSVRVTVRYADMDGIAIANDDVRTLRVGQSFTLGRTAITGWELWKAVEGTDSDSEAAGTVYPVTEAAAEKGEMVFTLFYRKKLTLTAASLLKQYDGTPLSMPADLSAAVTAEGLLDGDMLSSVTFRYTQQDGSDSEPADGRLNAGICLATPEQAVLTGAHTADYYSIRSVSGTLEVTRVSVTVRIEPDRWTNALYNGQPYRAGFTNPDKGLSDYVRISHAGYAQLYLDTIWNTVISGSSLQYDASAPGLGYVALSATDAGDYGYTLNITENDLPNAPNYSVGFFVRPGRLQILPIPVTVAANAAGKPYGEKDPELTALVTGLPEGVNESVLSWQLSREPGESIGTYAITAEGEGSQGNYSVRYTGASFTIWPAGELKVITEDYHGEYDGAAHTVSAYPTVTEGTELRYSTDGGSTWTAEAPAIKDAGQLHVLVRAVNPNYVTDEAEATLTVLPRQLVFRAASESKEYDGIPLENNDYTLEGSFVSGESAEVSVSGSQTIPGSSVNRLLVRLADGVRPENYAITTYDGLLVVTNRSARYEINLSANSRTELYSGGEVSVEGFISGTDFTFGGVRFRVEGVRAAASAVHAGTYPVRIEGSPVVRDAEGNDVTEQFLVNLADGLLTIRKRSLVFTSSSAEQEYTGSALTAETVSVSGDGFAEGEGVEFTVTGSRTLTGFSENTFSWQANENTMLEHDYSIRAEFGTLTVTNRSSRYLLEVEAESGTFLYDGQEHLVTGLKNSRFAIGSEQYTVSGLTASGSAVHAGVSPVPVSGTAIVRDSAGNDVTEQFTVTARPGSITILPRSLSLRSESLEKVYDATPLRSEAAIAVSGDGFAAGEGMSFTLTGSRTVPGISENSFSYTWNEGTDPADYTLTVNFGTLNVLGRAESARFELSVSAGSSACIYDGSAHTVSSLSLGSVTAQSGEAIPFTLNGQSFLLGGLSAQRSETAAGSYEVNVTGTPYVTDSAGNDVSSQFLIHTVKGTLQIGRRSLIMTSGSASHAYNGRELRNDSVTVSGDGFAAGEGAVFTVTGTRTLVGESRNTFTYELNAGTDPANYLIEQKFGTLTVTNRDARYEITLRANSADELYDGTEKTVSGLVSTQFVLDGVRYTVQGLTAEASGTDAGEIPVTVHGTAVVLDGNGNDVSSQFSVLKESGTLRILPRTVTLTSASASRAYNGDPLQDTGIVIGEDGFAPGEGVLTDCFASRILPGSCENSFCWTLQDNTATENYMITAVYGILSVTNRDALYEITLRPVSDDSIFYDGEEHRIEGFETTEFELDGHRFTVVDVTAGVAATEPGIHPAVITGEPRVLDENGNDVTEQFAVTIEPGYLTIRSTFVLTVRFRDRANPNRDLAQPFTGRYAPGENYGPIRSPAVAGYTPEYREVRSGADGMPARDLTVIVYYNAIRQPEEPEPEDGPDGGTTDPGTEETDPPAGLITERDDGETDLVTVAEEEIPLTKIAPAYWALLNLVMVMLTLLLSILLLLVRFLSRKEDKKEGSPDGDGPGEPSAQENEKTSVRTWHILLSL